MDNLLRETCDFGRTVYLFQLRLRNLQIFECEAALIAAQQAPYHPLSLDIVPVVGIELHEIPLSISAVIFFDPLGVVTEAVQDVEMHLHLLQYEAAS